MRTGDQGVGEAGIAASRDELAARGRGTGPITVAIRDLAVSYRRALESVLAVDSVDLDLESGEILALVGESGCGKSTLAATIAGALPEKTADVTVELFGSPVSNSAQTRVCTIRDGGMHESRLSRKTRWGRSIRVSR